MKLYTISVFLFISCFQKKVTSHLHIVEDGFFVRTKNKDLHEFLRFYLNGRVIVQEILFKRDQLGQYKNAAMCILDSAKNTKINDMQFASYYREVDSVFFTIEMKSYITPYNKNYRLKLYPDSLVGNVFAIDLDTTKYGQMKSVPVSFIFISALCDKSIRVPDQNYEVDEKILRKRK